MISTHGPIEIRRPPQCYETWITKDLRELRFAEMATSHLENLIVWVDKKILILEHELSEAVHSYAQSYDEITLIKLDIERIHLVGRSAEIELAFRRQYSCEEVSS